MARVIWDNTFKDANSSVFEVTNTPMVIRAYGLDGAPTVVIDVLSLFGQPGQFSTVPYSNDLPLQLSGVVNEVLIPSSGRFKLVVNDTNAAQNVVITMEPQLVTATADVPQPSGVQANLPNILVDTRAAMPTQSPVIDITDQAWLFVLYGTPANILQVVLVTGEGANEKETQFVVDGVPVFMDGEHPILKIARSGRYRIKPYEGSFGSNILVIGNPSTVSTEEIATGAATSGGIVGDTSNLVRIYNATEDTIARGKYVHSKRGFKDGVYSDNDSGVVLADCESRLVAHGFTLYDIPSGSWGWMATGGPNYYASIFTGSDTITPPLAYNEGNGLFYLGTNGDLLLEPPDSGSLVQATGGYSQETFAAPIFVPELKYPEIYDMVMPTPVTADLNGTQLVQNSDFSNDLDDWNASSGWSIAGGKASLDISSDPNGDLQQDIAIDTVPLLGGEGGIMLSVTVSQSDAASRTYISIGFLDEELEKVLLLGASEHVFSIFIDVNKLADYILAEHLTLQIKREDGSSTGTLDISQVTATAVASVVLPFLHITPLDGGVPVSHRNVPGIVLGIGSNAGALAATNEAYGNVLVGDDAGKSLRTGNSNTFIGSLAGEATQDTSNNTYVGSLAGMRMAGDDNTAIGANAMAGDEVYNASSNSNTAMGSNTLAHVENASFNTALGCLAGSDLLSGNRNVYVGYAAGTSAVAGVDNTFIGAQAGTSTTTGDNNVYIGAQAGHDALTAEGNTAIGYNSLYSNNATGQVAIGYQAGKALTSGANNTAVGYNAMLGATTETNSVALGYQASFSAGAGSDNTNVGQSAGYTNTDGVQNVNIGSQAGYTSTASGVTNVGYKAGYNNTTATGGVNIGYQAGIGVTSGNNNTFIGHSVAQTVSTGIGNVAIGYQASFTATTGNDNTNVGTTAGYLNNTGASNTNIGSQAGYTGTGTGNTNIGFKAGYAIASAIGNTNIGYQAGKAVTGADNTVIGYNALQAASTAANNVSIGSQAAFTATTGSANVNIGYQAGYTATVAANNVNVGYKAGFTGTGGNNTHVGYNAAQAATSAIANTVMGYQAGFGITTGSSNVVIGYEAGRYQADGATALQTPASSIYIGNGARGFNNSDSNTIVIGNGAIGTGANQASWGNTAINLHTFYGGTVHNEGGGDFDFRIEADTDVNAFFLDGTGDGLIGIGTAAPTVRLDIASNAMRLRTAKTPASATAAGDVGTICWDSGFIYVCVATNTWKRVAIATW